MTHADAVAAVAKLTRSGIFSREAVGQRLQYYLRGDNTPLSEFSPLKASRLSRWVDYIVNNPRKYIWQEERLAAERSRIEAYRRILYLHGLDIDVENDKWYEWVSGCEADEIVEERCSGVYKRSHKPYVTKVGWNRVLGTCRCRTCDQSLNYWGISAHLQTHRLNKENCIIEHADGTIKEHKFEE